jgi:hypothetical protein
MELYLASVERVGTVNQNKNIILVPQIQSSEH